MAEVETCGMCISAGRATSVEGLKSPEAVLGVSPLKAAAALTTGHLDDLQLAVEHVYLGHDIEDSRVQFVVAGELGDQPPVVCAVGQLDGLVIGRRLPGDGVNEPHWEWFGGSVADVGGGGEWVILEDRIAILAEGTEREGDWAIAQFDVLGLLHNTVHVGDGEIREAAVIFFKAIWALSPSQQLGICEKLPAFATH